MSDDYNLRKHIEGLEKERLTERITELEQELAEYMQRTEELGRLIDACISFIDSDDPERLTHFLPDFVKPSSWEAVLPGKIQQLMRDAK